MASLMIMNQQGGKFWHELFKCNCRLLIDHVLSLLCRSVVDVVGMVDLRRHLR